jgi:hypothetical protein
MYAAKLYRHKLILYLYKTVQGALIMYRLTSKLYRKEQLYRGRTYHVQADVKTVQEETTVQEGFKTVQGCIIPVEFTKIVANDTINVQDWVLQLLQA